MRGVCFGALFLLVTLAAPLNAAEKIDPEKFRGTLTTSQGGGVVYYRTHPFNRSHPSVRRVVIVVHGLGRTANGYFRAVYESAQADHRGVGTAIDRRIFGLLESATYNEQRQQQADTQPCHVDTW